MQTSERRSLASRVVAAVTMALLALPAPVVAQAPSPPPPASGAAPPPAGAKPADEQKTFSQAELEQLLAPIALYPDSLFAQVLMASTYPLDIVMADRWVKANPGVKDKALEDALQKQEWDPSVKSLAVFPQVLAMMSEKIDWTQKLGDAFLAQQQELMATAQTLRAKAVEQGSLKDSKEQKVITEKSETNTTIIKIEPTNPEVVYVPTYNPTVVYGAWAYPAYPPYYYYPPGYVAGGALLGFTAGVIVGGALWGNVGWGRGDVNVNVNRYNNFNKTNISNGNWQHNSDRRGAVPYRDSGTAQKYNRGASPNAASRDAYRGRDGGSMQQTRAGGRDAGASASATNRGGGSRPDLGASSSPVNRGGGGASGRDYSGRSSSAMDTGSRAQTSNFSNRGASSMNSARSSSGARAGGGGGGGRGGGGGGRGGGGRR
jgi:hypothetical protein